MKKHSQWALGFFGFFGFFAVPMLLSGEWNWGQAAWLVWFVWFLFFFLEPKQGPEANKSDEESEVGE